LQKRKEVKINMNILKFFKRRKPSLELTLRQAKAEFKAYKESKLKSYTEQEAKLSEQFGEALAELRRLLGELREAKLLNENIPIKEKNIMQGNRDSYISKAEYFISSLERLTISELSESFDSKLQQFLEASVKPYQVLVHFFESEIRAISRQLRMMEKLYKRINAFMSQTEIIRETEQLFEELEEAVKKQRLIGSEINKKKEKLKEFNERLKLLDDESAKLRNSREWAKIEQMHGEMEHLKKKKHDLENHIINILSPFSRVLRKYNKLKKDKLSLRLIETPCVVMKETPSALFGLLADALDLVTKDKLKFKSQDKNKILKRFAELDAKALTDQTSQLKETEVRIAKLNNELNSSRVMGRLEALDNEKRELAEGLSRIKNEIKELEQSKNNRIAELKSELGEKLKHLFRRDVKLV